MKKQNCFPLLLVLFLALSSGTVLGDEANVCANDPIHIVNCSKLACVMACVEKYGESINGACIDRDTCCCHIV
ncbi:hypothetical protein ACOSP7_028455 [Xanthoceras sorbifolium]